MKQTLSKIALFSILIIPPLNIYNTQINTPKERTHLQSREDIGSKYFISYSEGIQDLQKMAAKRLPEDVFIYLPSKKCWVDVGLRKKEDKINSKGEEKKKWKLGSRTNIKFVRLITDNEKYAFKLHFHPTQGKYEFPINVAPASITDFESLSKIKKYFKKYNNNCQLINQVVDENNIWEYKLKNSQIITYINTYLKESQKNFQPNKKELELIKNYKLIKKQYKQNNLNLYKQEKKEQFDKKKSINEFIKKSEQLGFNIHNLPLKKINNFKKYQSKFEPKYYPK